MFDDGVLESRLIGLRLLEEDLETMHENGSSNEEFFWYVLLALVVLLLTLAGYIGYVVYPRFELASVTGSGLLVLASAAGVASFFSPCSFPLLLTLLARETGREDGEVRTPLGRALGFAAALSLGATTFLLLAGAATALGGGSLFARVTFASTAGRIIRLVVGTFLVLLGLVQVGVIPMSFHGVEQLARPILKEQARTRREHPTRAFFVFGFGYLIAGFG